VAEEYLKHILKLLRDNEVPELSGEYEKEPSIVKIHEELKVIREILQAFSSGNFSSPITIQGIIPNHLKSLQTSFRNLIWQVQMIEKGDFTQEVHFTDEFSKAFNNIVRRLELSLSKLKEKEDSLADINNKLRKEVESKENLKESNTYFKFLASHDSLTGILNRRAFIETVEIELATAAYLCVPCCLAMMDIDHFKKFNDTHGHVAGDEALRHTVKVISSRLRKNDFMGRYGGEEFVLFFYYANKETGLKILDRLRVNLSESPVYLEKGLIEIHASFGLVEVDVERAAEKGYIQKLIRDADTALYSAKLSGRNKVVVFSQEMDSGYYEI
jgi:diguanylate cyclase (GGDEF)-like protein